MPAAAFRSCRGNPGVLLEMPARQVHRVAAEQLVRPFAREDDLDILRGVLREEVEGHFRRVGERLVHIILDFASHLEIVVGADLIRDILHPDHLRKVLGVGEFGVFFLFVPDGEGLDVFGALGPLP